MQMSNFKWTKNKVKTKIKFDDVTIWSNLWVIPETESDKLCQPIHYINYSTFICPFESRTCGKKVKKLEKIEYPENNCL